MGNTVRVSADVSKIGGFQAGGQTTHASSAEPIAKKNNITQVTVGNGAGVGSGTLKSETVSRKALDKVLTVLNFVFHTCGRIAVPCPSVCLTISRKETVFTVSTSMLNDC